MSTEDRKKAALAAFDRVENDVLLFLNKDWKPLLDLIRAELLSPISPHPEEAIYNLLAVIHRDGGHYTQEHGLKKSYADAVNVVLKAFDEAAKNNSELVKEMEHAVKYLQSCGYGGAEHSHEPEAQMLDGFIKALAKHKGDK